MTFLFLKNGPGTMLRSMQVDVRAPNKFGPFYGNPIGRNFRKESAFLDYHLFYPFSLEISVYLILLSCCRKQANISKRQNKVDCHDNPGMSSEIEMRQKNEYK